MGNTSITTEHNKKLEILTRTVKAAAPGVTIVTQLTAPKPISGSSPQVPLEAIFALLNDLDADCPYTGFNFKDKTWQVADGNNILKYNDSYYVVWINCIISLEFFSALLWQAGWSIKIMTWEVLEAAGPVRDLYKDEPDDEPTIEKAAATPNTPPVTSHASLMCGWVDDYEACTDDELTALADAGDEFAQQELNIRLRQRAIVTADAGRVALTQALQENKVITMPTDEVRKALIRHAHRPPRSLVN